MRTRARRLLPAILVVVLICVFAAPAAAEPIAAITPGNVLIRFDTATPHLVTTVGPVTGLGANEAIRGIDVRPSTGQVYVATVTTGAPNNSIVRLYTLDPITGQATPVGNPVQALAGAADLPTGFDAVPTLDQMRYVNLNDENSRFNPTTSALINDTDLTPAATTTIIAAAYDRNRPGQSASTLYAIDRNDSQVSIQGGINGTPSPNGGVVTDLAPLGFTAHAAGDGGFDISAGGTAYAALVNAADGRTRLYSIALPTAVTATPAATERGQIGNGLTQVMSMTVLDDDRDSDEVLTSADNCAASSNPDQADLDSDGAGDACDGDDDGDGAAEGSDNCPTVANGDQADLDADGGGDACDADQDGDGIANSSDLCPSTAGGNQADLDADGQGDDCDADDDGDGVSDTAEAALGSNPRLTDSDGDGKPDQVDACVVQAGSLASGCPPGTAPTMALTSSVSRFPRTIRVRRLRRRGVSFRVAPNMPASYRAELVGRTKDGQLAAVGELVLAESKLPRAAGARTMRVRVRRSQRGLLHAGMRLRVRVTATASLGRTDADTRRLRVRR